MAKKEKATFAAPNTNVGKYSKNVCIRSAIKDLFRTRKKFTARKINQLTHSNDARKQISELRRAGWDSRCKTTGWQ